MILMSMKCVETRTIYLPSELIYFGVHDCLFHAFTKSRGDLENAGSQTIIENDENKKQRTSIPFTTFNLYHFCQFHVKLNL